LVDKAYGYGIEGIKIDGNNILEVYDTIRGVRNYCIDEQKPYLIECMTFRMRGHEEASGVKYVPNELFEEWEKKDPVRSYEEWLLSADIMDVDQLCAINDELRLKIEEELKAGLAFQKNKVDLQEELNDVYAPNPSSGLQLQLSSSELPQRNEPIRMINAISEALDQSLALHENLVVMGQDIAEYGGAFKVTEGLVHKYVMLVLVHSFMHRGLVHKYVMTLRWQQQQDSCMCSVLVHKYIISCALTATPLELYATRLGA
jgi:2-oxoisovalerate dehydrogenase E1 component